MPPHDGDVHLEVLQERISNFIEESQTDREDLRMQITALRQQTHDWMQAMLNRLPPWAVAVGGLMCSTLGAMAMWIIQHK